MKNIKYFMIRLFVLFIGVNTTCFDDGYTLDTSNVSYALNNADDLDVLLQDSTKASRGNSELMLAVIDSNYDNVESLLKDRSVDLNSINDDGMTALHFAAEAGDGLTLRLLLDYGALVDAVDHQGNSPLHLAVNKNSFAAAQELVDRGADISLVNVDNKIPFDLAHNNRMKSILSELY